jgi:hypothetical protein
MKLNQSSFNIEITGTENKGNIILRSFEDMGFITLT